MSEEEEGYEDNFAQDEEGEEEQKQEGEQEEEQKLEESKDQEKKEDQQEEQDQIQESAQQQNKVQQEEEQNNIKQATQENQQQEAPQDGAPPQEEEQDQTKQIAEQEIPDVQQEDQDENQQSNQIAAQEEEADDKDQALKGEVIEQEGEENTAEQEEGCYQEEGTMQQEGTQQEEGDQNEEAGDGAEEEQEAVLQEAGEEIQDATKYQDDKKDNDKKEVVMKMEKKPEQQQQSNKQVKQLNNDPYTKRNYMIFLRQLINNINEPNMKSLIFYKLSGKNYVETKLRSVIEIPFEKNESVEKIQFQIRTIFTDEEIYCESGFDLPDLKVTEAEPYKSFFVKFQGKDDHIDKEFALIFDVGVIQTSLEGAVKDVDYDSGIYIFTINITQEQDKFKKFKDLRIKQQKSKFQLAQNRWDLRHRVDIRLYKQQYMLWLDDQEINDIYIFYIDKPLKQNQEFSGLLEISLNEIVVETFIMDDGYRNDIVETREGQPELIGKQYKIDLKTNFINMQRNNIAMNIDFTEIEIGFHLSLVQNTSFHEKYLGFTAIKILETRLFDTALDISHLEVKLNSMDDSLPVQCWKLKPFKQYTQNLTNVITWDFEHNRVYQNNLQKADENIDVEIPKEFTNLIFQPPKDQKKKQPIVYEIQIPKEEDFSFCLQNYVLINKYVQVLEEKYDKRDIVFFNRENHIFFKTISPFDYITIAMYNEDKLIGLYEESFYKLPENQLILGYLNKATGGKIKSKFREEGEEQIDDDNEDDNVIGTIKFTMDHIGYNQQINKNNKWIYELESTEEDDDRLVQIIKNTIINYPNREKKIYTIKMSLVEIWNILDLLIQIIKGDQFQLRIKLGSISYTITFKLERIQKRSFKNKNVLYSLDKEHLRFYTETIEDLRYFYTKNGDEILVLSTDMDISSTLIFEISNTRDHLIYEIRNFPQNQIIAYTTSQIGQMFIIDQRGTVIIPMTIPKRLSQIIKQEESSEIGESIEQMEPESLKENMIIENKSGNLNSAVFFKFHYEIIQQDDDFNRGIYKIGYFMTPLFMKKEVQKRIINFVYELQVYDLEKSKMEAISKQIIFNPKLIKYATEYVIGCEFYRSGDLRLRIVIKRLFSDDPNEDQGDIPLSYDKVVFINTSKDEMVQAINGMTFLKNQNTKFSKDEILQIKINMNSYALVPIQFYESAISQNLELELCISFRSNRYVNDPKARIYMTLTPDLEKKMTSSGILDAKATLVFKLTSNNAKAKTQKKQKQKQIYYCGEKPKQTAGEQQALTNEVLEFTSFDHRDNFLIEIYNDNNLSDSAFEKISNLIILPIYKSKSDSNIKVLNDKNIKIDQKDQQLEEEDWKWTFINFSDKKMEFLIRFQSLKTPVVSDDEEKAQSKQGEVLAKSQTIQNATKPQKIESEVIKLKRKIQQIKNENSKWTTKLTREKKELDKTQKQYDELIKIINNTNPVKSAKSAESGQSKPPINKEKQEKLDKAKQLFLQTCICGKTSEMTRIIKGYCGDCLKKIKEEYEATFKLYQPDADKYEELYMRNLNMDMKVRCMKKKIENYKKKAAFIDTDDNVDEKMLAQEITYLRENIKINEAQLIMINKEQKRIIDEKYQLQNDIEQKIQKKQERLSKIQSQIQEFENRNIILEQKVKDQSQQLQQIKDDIKYKN